MSEEIKGCLFLRKSDIGYRFFPPKAKYHILDARVSVEERVESPNKLRTFYKSNIDFDCDSPSPHSHLRDRLILHCLTILQC